MKTIEATITTTEGVTYCATLDLRSNDVTICKQDQGVWIWSSDGKWDGGIANCAADLGDEAYGMLDEALSGALDAARPKIDHLNDICRAAVATVHGERAPGHMSDDERDEWTAERELLFMVAVESVNADMTHDEAAEAARKAVRAAQA